MSIKTVLIAILLITAFGYIACGRASGVITQANHNHDTSEIEQMLK